MWTRIEALCIVALAISTALAGPANVGHGGQALESMLAKSLAGLRRSTLDRDSVDSNATNSTSGDSAVTVNNSTAETNRTKEPQKPEKQSFFGAFIAGLAMISSGEFGDRVLYSHANLRIDLHDHCYVYHEARQVESPLPRTDHNGVHAPLVSRAGNDLPANLQGHRKPYIFLIHPLEDHCLYVGCTLPAVRRNADQGRVLHD